MTQPSSHEDIYVVGPRPLTKRALFTKANLLEAATDGIVKGAILAGFLGAVHYFTGQANETVLMSGSVFAGISAIATLVGISRKQKLADRLDVAMADNQDHQAAIAALRRKPSP